MWVRMRGGGGGRTGTRGAHPDNTGKGRTLPEDFLLLLSLQTITHIIINIRVRADSGVFVIHCRGPVCPPTPKKGLTERQLSFIWSLQQKKPPAVILVTAPPASHCSTHNPTKLQNQSSTTSWNPGSKSSLIFNYIWYHNSLVEPRLKHDYINTKQTCFRWNPPAEEQVWYKNTHLHEEDECFFRFIHNQKTPRLCWSRSN